MHDAQVASIKGFESCLLCESLRALSHVFYVSHASSKGSWLHV